jgi:arabinosaccharide transport system substrate-binding protein
MLSIMLLQRHINLIDADYTIHINDPKVAQTLAFYAQAVAGDHRISTEASDTTTREYYTDLANGNFGAFLMPDWQIDYARKLGPENAGKIRVIPLPRFDSDDARTATYGGTLICIPRHCPHPDEAWKLIEFLYLSPQGLAGRDKIGILPPLPEEWHKPQYHEPDPFFGGQPVLSLYTQLAREAPPAYMTPITGMALGTLSYVQSRAVEYVKRQGPTGLERQCQIWLDEAAVDLQARIDHVRFD